MSTTRRTDRIAGVRLLDNPYFIDGVYDYRIPPELEDEVSVGGFVTVPFGRSNVMRLALVTEIKDSSEHARLKSVCEVCPETLTLDEEMLGLCTFMRQRTLCSTGDAVRAMIPASALSRLITTYFPCGDHTPTSSDDKQSSDLFVYEYIRDNPATRAEALRRRFGKELSGALHRLLSRGLIRKEYVLEGASEGRLLRVWETSLSASEAYALLDGGEVRGMRLTGEKQKDALRAVIESDVPLSTAELKEHARVTEAPLKTLLSRGILSCRDARLERNPYGSVAFVGQTPMTLNVEQAEALETLDALATAPDARAALLYGVTGSGKTAVMISLIDRLLLRGQGVILLLPEIALTPQSVSIFCARYGERVALIHSALSQGERYDAYCRIRDGRADVVIGTRSAVFSPVKNLGAIIIDEEQEHTYKSDQNPKYHARDIARYRCAAKGALMLLASATPSLESYHKAREGVYTLVRLTKRYGGATLPRVIVADLRAEAGKGALSPLGERLTEQLAYTRQRGEQAVLFLNRRGYNHYVSCHSCGEALKCPSCSVALTYHTRRGTYEQGDMVCHWCGTRLPLPKTCPSCASPHLSRMGFGTQRAEEELGALFPTARLLRMDTDTTAAKFSYDTMLSTFRAGEADILLGTQMVTKGHDFPNVTLVGVLSADSSLYLDDYRAAERTFSMLTQVIGRAGRGEKEGVAVIQTSNPDHEVIRLACAQDYEGFYEREIRLRRLLTFPPFCDIALLTVSSAEENGVLRESGRLAALLDRLLSERYEDVQIVKFGPFEAPVYRVENKYRMRMVLKCKLTKRTLALLSELFCSFSAQADKNVSLSVDLNPSNL